MDYAARAFPGEDVDALANGPAMVDASVFPPFAFNRYAVVIPPEFYRSDISWFHLDGKRKLLLQVKSLSRCKPPVPLGKDVEGFMGDYWIIVTEATADKPTCYILTPKQVKSMAHKGEKDGRISYWLPHKRYAVKEFCEQWNRIGPGC